VAEVQKEDEMELYREYETVALLHPDTLEDGVQRFHHKVQEVVGRERGLLLKVESWGKKKLAYEVKKESKGIFTYYRYLGGSNVVDAIERTLRYADAVLRYQTVFLADRVQPADRAVDDSAKTDFLAAAEAAAKVSAEGIKEAPPTAATEMLVAAAAPAEEGVMEEDESDGGGEGHA
jgi:small subunit ribosomal protein S6